MFEAALRDLISEQIHILEEGLTLLDIEKYVPHRLGTRGFIDLLAKDAQNRWVLIEVKRSNAAEREAIHEIHKYVEGVKDSLGARDDDIRTIVVSTEWGELLVPFSRFVLETSFSVVGLKISLSDTGSISSVDKVSPLPVTSGRVLSPWHEVSLYTSEERLRNGIESHDASCKKRHP